MQRVDIPFEALAFRMGVLNLNRVRISTLQREFGVLELSKADAQFLVQWEGVV